jgi:hypothetical protein
VKGMKLHEAAGKMGWSLAATRNHYYRGMMHLRVLITNQNRPTGQCTQALVSGNGKLEVGNHRARTV